MEKQKPDTKLEILRKRAEIIQSIRCFFIDSGYLEVDTPLLSPFLIPESAIEVFKTVYNQGINRFFDLYLIPSPELWMKRLLAMGTGSIFQITKSFRNYEPQTHLHEAEFTMLEWYTVNADYMNSIAVTEAFFSFLLDKNKLSTMLEKNGIDFSVPFERISMHEAFKKNLNLNLIEHTDIHSITKAARSLGCEISSDDSWADIFHKLFLTYIEAGLPADRPVILYDYPSKIQTLAKKKGFWAERWELYIAGIEVANCYSEETDPLEIERFYNDAGSKEFSVPHKFDTELIEYMRENFPVCSGVALGVDRLLMLLLGRKSLGGVNFFSLSDTLRC